MNIGGKAALITGGDTGVGRATALALARRGCSVAVNYDRSEEAAAQTAAAVRACGVRGITIKADVANDASCRRLVDQAVRELGGLHVLVNNAGQTVFVPHGDLDGVGDAIVAIVTGSDLVTGQTLPVDGRLLLGSGL